MPIHAVSLLAVALATAQVPERQLFTNTRHVEDLLVVGDTLWAATRGGVEQYDLRRLLRQRVYTTEDGLPSLAARELRLVAGRIEVGVDGARCSLLDGSFLCNSQPTATAADIPGAPQVEGRRATRMIEAAGHTIAGTAGRGIWLDGHTPLTPRNQICSNHIVAIAAWRGRTWFGSFDNGLCSHDGVRFEDAALPSLLVNDLAATPDGLFVATSDGLFRTRNGETFERLTGMAHAINDLAYDRAQRVLYATNPGVLYRLPLSRSRVQPRQWWMPGGSRSLQAVAAHRGNIWLASEDRGALHLVRGRFRVHDRAAGLPTSWAVDVALADDGTAYVATLRHGIVSIGRGGATRLPQRLDPWALFVDAADGALWIGTQNGAAVIRGQQMSPIAPLPQPCAHVVTAVGDRLWIGTEGGLLATAIPPSGPLACSAGWEMP
ncbi:MAG: hypothetical protein JXR83_21775 [Deltaproteobacteria bacterium]|nr:hypothetical protein [Deltaproteobacteria bacterium]